LRISFTAALVSPTLNQHVEDLALVIDGLSEIHPLAGNAHDSLIQVPPAAGSKPPPL
jgi:hypothetical protein